MNAHSLYCSSIVRSAAWMRELFFSTSMAERSAIGSRSSTARVNAVG